MSDTSFDVNLLVGYGNLFDQRNKQANYFFNTIAKKYERCILLKKVKAHFIKTYSDKLKSMGDAIVISVNQTKDDFHKSIAKTPLIKQVLFKKHFEAILSKQDLHSNIHFFDLLTAKFPILQLIEDNNALTRFIDEFIRQAHDQTLAIIIQLQKKLKNKIIDQPNFNEQTFVRWMQHIKQSKNKFKVFNDVDDEDIRISANLIEFSFHNGAQPDFYSCDNDIIRSLNTIKTKIPELKKILNGKFLKI